MHEKSPKPPSWPLPGRTEGWVGANWGVSEIFLYGLCLVSLASQLTRQRIGVTQPGSLILFSHLFFILLCRSLQFWGRTSTASLPASSGRCLPSRHRDRMDRGRYGVMIIAFLTLSPLVRSSDRRHDLPRDDPLCRPSQNARPLFQQARPRGVRPPRPPHRLCGESGGGEARWVALCLCNALTTLLCRHCCQYYSPVWWWGPLGNAGHWLIYSAFTHKSVC